MYKKRLPVFEELINSESFQNWILGKASEEEKQYWERWKTSNPEKEAEFERAQLFLLNLKGEESPIGLEDINRSWDSFKQKIKQEEATHLTLKRSDSKIFHLQNFYRYAAVITLCLVAGILIYTTSKIGKDDSFLTYETAYGETREIALQDGTIVILNANSSMKVPSGKSFNRTVIMESGEAFFKVQSTLDKERFQVQTAQAIIEVLGTEFNVNLRRSDFQIMLKEGRVSLINDQGNTISMRPGESAVLSPEGKFVIEQVEVHKIAAWLEGKVVFDKTPLVEVAQFIEDQYNMKVELAPELSSQMLTGELPNDNLELLLKALRISHNLNITRHNENIKITE